MLINIHLFALKLSEDVLILLITVRMPTIVGILTIVSMIKYNA